MQGHSGTRPRAPTLCCGRTPAAGTSTVAAPEHTFYRRQCRGPGTAFEFALALVKLLYGEEKMREVAAPMVRGWGRDREGR